MTEKPAAFDPKRLNQQQLAAITGRRPSWLRETRTESREMTTAPTTPRQSSMLSPANAIRWSLREKIRSGVCRQLDLGFTGGEHLAQALVQFLDGIRQRHRAGGLLAVLDVWRNSWSADEKFFQLGPAEVDSLLDHVSRCDWCGAFRWGEGWEKKNPRPDLVVGDGCCPECLAKK